MGGSIHKANVAKHIFGRVERNVDLKLAGDLRNVDLRIWASVSLTRKCSVCMEDLGDYVPSVDFQESRVGDDFSKGLQHVDQEVNHACRDRL